MRTALVTGVACGVVVLAGCSGPDSTTPATPTLSDARVAVILKGAAENTKFLYDAEQQLTARCMRRAGFRYQAGTKERDGIADPFRGTQLTAEEARREGYGLSHTESSNSRKDPNAETVAGLSKEEAKRYQEALIGTPDSRITVTVGNSERGSPGGGCVAEARKTIYGDLKKRTLLSFVSNDVLAEASHTVESDEGLIDARKEWSRCMDRAGFHYDSRRKARSSLSKRYFARNADVDAVFHDEIATATADAKCSQSTGFDTALRKAQAHASAVAVTKHESDLVAAHQMNTQAVARAKKALANP